MSLEFGDRFIIGPVGNATNPPRAELRAEVPLGRVIQWKVQIQFAPETLGGLAGGVNYGGAVPAYLFCEIQSVVSGATIKQGKALRDATAVAGAADETKNGYPVPVVGATYEATGREVKVLLTRTDANALLYVVDVRIVPGIVIERKQSRLRRAVASNCRHDIEAFAVAYRFIAADLNHSSAQTEFNEDPILSAPAFDSQTINSFIPLAPEAGFVDIPTAGATDPTIIQFLVQE